MSKHLCLQESTRNWVNGVAAKGMKTLTFGSNPSVTISTGVPQHQMVVFLLLVHVLIVYQWCFGNNSISLYIIVSFCAAMSWGWLCCVYTKCIVHLFHNIWKFPLFTKLIDMSGQVLAATRLPKNKLTGDCWKSVLAIEHSIRPLL